MMAGNNVDHPKTQQPHRVSNFQSFGQELANTLFLNMLESANFFPDKETEFVFYTIGRRLPLVYITFISTVHSMLFYQGGLQYIYVTPLAFIKMRTILFCYANRIILLETIA